ncbi:MAG: hypothetical protein K9L88_14505 [Chromatiaceae bacterium]|nr:hypothetical protein [Chromatiaceae bacterium]
MTWISSPSLLDGLITDLARPLNMQDLTNDDYTRMMQEIETTCCFHGA